MSDHALGQSHAAVAEASGPRRTYMQEVGCRLVVGEAGQWEVAGADAFASCFLELNIL